MTAAAAPGSAASRRDGAAARLYVDYRDRIYRFCLSRLRSHEEAEDAVQNVFMRVHTALDRGVVPEYEAAWLYKIAHNVCLSRAESRSRRAGVELLSSFDDDDELAVAAPDVSRDELAGLNEALEAMPQNLRTALLLREWQGLSYTEIADAMGLSVSAVETLLFRARRHLASALEGGGGAKRRTVVSRALDLLGLGWFRDLLATGGPAADLAAGAALLALGGGGVAIAFATDAHSRPLPTPVVSVPSASFLSSTTGVRASHVVTPPPTTTRPVVAGLAQFNNLWPAPATLRTATLSWTPRPLRATRPAAETAPSPVTETTTPVTRVVAATAPVPTVPSAPVPTDSVPTVSVPTATVPSATVPTVSVPDVTVPAVSLPVGGGGVGGLVGGG